ncbi:MAG: T9SS type A sorting domain-containing protein [candidate division KSB1 bacterium]
MNRRELLKGVGALGLGSLLPRPQILSAEEKAAVLQAPSTCFLTPQATEGPYYFDPKLIRQDITPDTTTGVIKTGLPLNIEISVINFDCVPIPNVLVDIWHCDKNGVYSGYAGQPGGINTVGQTFLRGTQMTDANGKCLFKTIYPGWYPGRVTHIHFKVRLTSSTYVTSQFAFPDSLNTTVYQTPLYVAKGQNSLTNATDGIFRTPNPEHLVLAATPNTATGGYDGTFTIGINATTRVGESDSENPTEFSLRQNYPNPFNPTTTISYHLPKASKVRLTVFDVFGREVANLVEAEQAAGNHEANFDARALSSGFYLYTLIAGSFAATKEMLLMK